MKRWLWYGLIIAAVAFFNGNNSAGTDAAQLQAVQTVRVSCPEGRIRIETDTGELGIGDDLKHAFENMKHTASAQVFLDTADYLILTGECQRLLPSLMNYFRPSCSVCLEDGQSDLELAGAYLKIHDPGFTLKDYRAGEHDLPKLKTREGRMELVS